MTLAYTGSPGHKDLFDHYLEATLQIDPAGKKLLLKVAGLTEADILKYPAMKKRGLNTVPPCVHTIGKVSHDSAVALVREADFSILLRKPTRVAKAGFPTKFVESLAVGTPVIANITSDLEQYLKDSETGLVCEDYTVGAFIRSIERAFKLSHDDFAIMRRSARKIAEEYFDYRVYVDKFKGYLRTVK